MWNLLSLAVFFFATNGLAEGNIAFKNQTLLANGNPATTLPKDGNCPQYETAIIDGTGAQVNYVFNFQLVIDTNSLKFLELIVNLNGTFNRRGIVCPDKDNALTLGGCQSNPLATGTYALNIPFQIPNQYICGVSYNAHLLYNTEFKNKQGKRVKLENQNADCATLHITC